MVYMSSPWKSTAKVGQRGSSSVTSYDNTPGAGAEPGLLRCHLQNAAVPARARSGDSAGPGSGDGGRQRRAQRAARWQLLHRANTAAHPSPRQRHTSPAPRNHVPTPNMTKVAVNNKRKGQVRLPVKEHWPAWSVEPQPHRAEHTQTWALQRKNPSYVGTGSPKSDSNPTVLWWQHCHPPREPKRHNRSQEVQVNARPLLAHTPVSQVAFHCFSAVNPVLQRKWEKNEARRFPDQRKDRTNGFGSIKEISKRWSQQHSKSPLLLKF